MLRWSRPDIVRKGRLQPGKLFLVDLERGRIVPDEELKAEVAAPPRRTGAGTTEDGRASRRPARAPSRAPAPRSRCAQRQLAFGYAQEDLKVILGPLARNGKEPTGSMGDRRRARRPSPTARRSSSPTSSSSSRRSRTRRSTRSARTVVMSLQASVGSERNLLAETPEHARQLRDREPDPARRASSSSCVRCARRSSGPTRSTRPGRAADGAGGAGGRARAALRTRPTRR